MVFHIFVPIVYVSTQIFLKNFFIFFKSEVQLVQMKLLLYTNTYSLKFVPRPLGTKRYKKNEQAIPTLIRSNLYLRSKINDLEHVFT